MDDDLEIVACPTIFRSTYLEPSEDDDFVQMTGQPGDGVEVPNLRIKHEIVEAYLLDEPYEDDPFEPYAALIFLRDPETE
jgi:hypothetical protein